MEHAPKTPIALITGAAKRVGRDLALALAADGYNIALHYSSSQDEAKATAADIRNLGVRCEIFQADLRDHSAVTALIPAVTKTLGAPTLLINNASIFNRVSLADSTEATFDDHFKLHVKAPFFLAQSFAKHTTTGNIINITDTYIRSQEGAYFAYLLSKKSLADLTPMLARELAPNIRVNAVALGMMEHNDNLSPEYVTTRTRKLPFPRPVTVAELHQTISSILNQPTLVGQTIFLDNGASLL